MRSTADHQFISTDVDELDALLCAGYEQVFGTSVRPGSPERLFISWIEDAIIYERALNNHADNQNLPSRAEGENLDALAELFYLQQRPQPTAATCTMRFNISEARQSAILIPSGTRVTDANASLYWATAADEYVPIGSTYTDVTVVCQTSGTVGNDFAVGDINTIVDVYDYYSGCSNVTASANGSDAPDDDEFYQLLLDSQAAWSSAGPVGSYKYFAKSVSTKIADVVANSPSPGTVCLYAVMDALEQARAEIDTVDAQLAALFERRMAAVLQVAEYKRAHGLPIYDAAREAAVLEKAAARIQQPALRPYYKDHVQHMMDLAKQYEAAVLGRNRAAYQGVEGAFAHIALKALFPHAEAVSYSTWDEVFEAVASGEAAHGVVPFENSHAGDVSAVLDLCYNHPELWVVDVYDLPISQNLLVLPGTQLSQLRTVYSHQQAIAQSETFLKQFRLPATAMANTAMAAKFVAESKDATKAAIASAETAALYGLEILVPNINTDGDNTTRFIVLSREKPTAGNRFSLLFTVDNKPGKLAEVIQVIGASGFNMESIKSRPMPHVPFEYYFYVELVGDAAAGETAALLRELDRTCRTVRLLGVYTK